MAWSFWLYLQKESLCTLYNSSSVFCVKRRWIFHKKRCLYFVQVLGCVLPQASQKFQVFPPSKLRRLQQHLSTNILDTSSVLLSHTSLYKQRWKLWRQEKAFCMASKVCVISGILWVETKICLTYLSGLIVSLWKRKPAQLLQLSNFSWFAMVSAENWANNRLYFLPSMSSSQNSLMWHLVAESFLSTIQ